MPTALALDLSEVLVRLAELGPPTEVRRQSPAIAADALDFDRVVLSGMSGGMLVADAIYAPADGDDEALLGLLEQGSVELAYPLVEAEIHRRRRAQVVRFEEGTGAWRYAFADLLGGTDRAIAPVLLDGHVAGFFHADRAASGRDVDESDADELGAFSVCFGLTYERAVLRTRLRVQQEELRRLAGWAEARTHELGERSITLADTDGRAPEPVPRPIAAGGEQVLTDVLTRRELDVLRLIVRGETNAGIAKILFISDQTAKFHVRNILRKLGASNRADATSRYLRMTLDARVSDQHRR